MPDQQGGQGLGQGRGANPGQREADADLEKAIKPSNRPHEKDQDVKAQHNLRNRPH